MLDQSEEPDYYRYTLRVPMDREPGEKAVYCSIDPNLALGVLGRATGESPLDRVRSPGRRADARSRRYAWPLDPAGQPYGGGGVQFLPRDFMKLGQLMLDGGTWQGRRILDARVRGARVARRCITCATSVRLSVVEHRLSVQGPHGARLLRRRQGRPGA